MNKDLSFNTTSTILFFVLFLTALISNYYMYYYAKNYTYLIESKCNPENEECSYRDCENDPDICPPNNLSYFKTYSIKAYDFQKCSDNSCELECAIGVISCERVPSLQ